MKKAYLLVINTLLLVFSIEGTESPRKIILLEDGWRFINKDIENAETSLYDDSAWEEVTVPHDWAIGKPFDMNIDEQVTQVVEDGELKPYLRTGRTGALPAIGVGWYRRPVVVSESDKGKRFFVEFDGAMSQAKIYMNGAYVGEWPYGYSSFSVEVTKYIKYGQINLLAVRLENKARSSRFYTGAGIYRNVRFVMTNPVHVAHWGTYITTPVLTNGKGVVNIKTEVSNQSGETRQIELLTEIVTASGTKVASDSQVKVITDKDFFEQKIPVIRPLRWDPDSPVRYKAISKLFVNKELRDVYETFFGFRTLKYDKNKGFFLNDKHVKLKGVCLHHDLGPLGAAVNVRATERQLEIMKEMGCNAVRTAHNPPSPELVNLCDSMGLMLMVEAFDEWKVGKCENGYHTFFDDWAKKDIKAMVRRDRNNPSVIMWSIGNEIRDLALPEGALRAKFLADICKREDPSRLVTAALNNYSKTLEYGCTEAIDLIGCNYASHDYKSRRRKNPDYIFFGSETAATVSSRGVYKFPAKELITPWHNDYQLSGYDLEHFQWSQLPDEEFEKQDELPYLLGEFAWAGFDYLGEPSPYNEGTPARSSYFGIVDLAGLKKDRYFLYQSQWCDKPVLHLLPHWNWENKINDTVPVFCYTNYPKAELFVNGKSMGIKEKDKSSTLNRYRLIWSDVIYEPGEIKVIALDNSGIPVASESVLTASEPYRLKLTPDRDTIKADGKDLSFITVEVLDKTGNLCPHTNSLVFFNVTGVGRLRAICNGDPTDQTPFSSNYMRLFGGKLVLVVEAKKETGNIIVEAKGSKLRSSKVNLVSRRTELRLRTGITGTGSDRFTAGTIRSPRKP